MKHEIEAGQNMVLGAEECGVKHFVFSSLPDMVSATGGRFVNIHHMNNKYEVEKFARERLSHGVTCLIPGLYHSSAAQSCTDSVQDSFILICVGLNILSADVSSA